MLTRSTGYEHLGAYLCAKRKEAGLSVEEAAIALGYPQHQILSQIEHNQTALTLDKIPKISEVYSISAEDIAGAVIDEQLRIMAQHVKENSANFESSK